ncbi:MAG: tetratricopeptide repeat protein [Dysgonomonas sp.]|nr:tetratricopeptide repeat protein [Dysgonomonas sp.]
MKSLVIYIFFSLCCFSGAYSQTLAEAKEFYLKGEFEKALPVMETEYNAKPTDANLNQWYGVCLFETGGDMKKAEECLVVASKKNIQDSFLYLGRIYTEEYRFEEAEESFDKYETLLKKNPKRKKEDLAKFEENSARLEGYNKRLSRLSRMASNTEDIQIIDSIVVNKADFLSAYKLSLSSGKLSYFNDVFNSNKKVESVVYSNEKGTKIYYGQPDKNNTYSLYSMEKLMNEYGNEKALSVNSFGLSGNVNYPYMMTDGVTIYFAAEDEETLGGYDLFISRYNMNNDTFLTPERLNMPFNSIYNDYMMAVDEEKGIGWFASDRFQPEGKVCIYTFIPNSLVKIVENDDDQYMANRARISSIKDSWEKGKNYSSLIALARKAAVEEVKTVRDFIFVINDNATYYKFADFKNATARDTYFRAVQLKADLKNLEEKLETERNKYIGTTPENRRSMVSNILSMEKQLEQIQKEIPQLEIQARSQEIRNMK